MSEYWVSKKKYFCKYCEIYIADDVPSRRQHENGLRHQGNRERFIKNIYKTSEKKKKDLEEEKRELARVDQAAHAAFAQDISAGYASPVAAAASSSAPTSAVRKPATRPSNPFTNYTTAESLGYTDPDAERAAAEAELRRTQGVVGDWQVITPPTPPRSKTTELGVSATPSVQIPSKRAPETHADDDYDCHSKLRERTIDTGLGEIYDPGVITIKKTKKEGSLPPTAKRGTEGNSDTILSSVTKQEDDQAKPTEASKWVKVQWLDGATAERGESAQPRSGDELREVEEPLPGEPPIKTGNKVEETETLVSQAGSSLFKRRKTPASAGAGRSRRQL